MRLLFMSITFLSFFIFAAPTPHAGENANSGKKPTLHDKVYYFQHRLLPKWTFNSKGAFFNDLMHDRHEKLKKAAIKIVGEDFRKKITIRKYIDVDGVLLTFPTPKEAAECYFIYIARDENEFSFYTYEKTADLLGSGHKGAVCGWSPDMTHINYGFRKYDDAASFVADIHKKE